MITNLQIIWKNQVTIACFLLKNSLTEQMFHLRSRYGKALDFVNVFNIFIESNDLHNKPNQRCKIILMMKYFKSSVLLIIFGLVFTNCENNKVSTDSKLLAIEQAKYAAMTYQDSIREALFKLNKLGVPQVEGYVVSIQEDSISIKKWEGKTTLLYFWATWCSPCLEKIPALYQKMEKYKVDLNFLLISTDEDKSNWKNVITQRNWLENSYWIGAESLNNPMLAYAYQEFEGHPIISLPSCILINKAGTIVYNNAPIIKLEQIDSLINVHLN